MAEITLELATARYVSLETFRRSGIAVATPVWIARSGSRYYVFSEGTAGKIKRLRNNSRARLASCDMRGAVSGAWIESTAQVTNDAKSIASAYIALRDKYGWQMKAGDFFSKLTGRYVRRAMIEIEINDD